MMKTISKLMLTVLCLFGCSNNAEDSLDRFAAEIERRVSSGDATAVHLARYTDFTWEEVYIFPPYTPYEQIGQVLGGWNAVNTGIEYRDDATLLVFVRGGEVIKWTMFARGRGDLGAVSSPHGLSASEARFYVRQEDQLGTPWVVLELATSM